MKEVNVLWESNNAAAALKASKLLLKVTGNVLQSPDEAKFRSLPLAKVGPRLAAAQGAMELLEHCGFQKSDTQTHLVLTRETEQWENLVAAWGALTHRVDEATVAVAPAQAAPVTAVRGGAAAAVKEAPVVVASGLYKTTLDT